MQTKEGNFLTFFMTVVELENILRYMKERI